MGQYYKVVNIDKKEYMYSDGGIKLMEWSYNRNPLVLNIMKKLANEWKGDRVFVVGDYALSGDRIDRDSNEKDYDYDLLEKIEKELDIYDKEDGGYAITLYNFADKNYQEIKLENIEDEEYKYIYNHKRKEFINLDHCPLAWLYKEKNNYVQVKIAPISLLLALGNGMGGGDYWSNNENLVGKYINEVQDLEMTKEPLNLDYTEFRPEFYEGLYIPYNEIPNEINLERSKEKLIREIVDCIINYDNKYFKETYRDRKDAINRMSYLSNYTMKTTIEELSKIAKYNTEEVKEKCNELMERINNYKIQNIVRSNKNKSDMEFKNEINEDKYINETYKNIFNDLKLKNIESIETNNKETTITFDTEEQQLIKTDDKNNIQQFIQNTKLIETNSKNQKKAIRYKELDERISKKQKNPDLFYYEYRENDGEKVIEKGVWVDFAGTLVTNKEILGEKEFIDYNQLFDNPKILMIQDNDLKEQVEETTESEEEEVQ